MLVEERGRELEELKRKGELPSERLLVAEAEDCFFSGTTERYGRERVVNLIMSSL